MTTTTSPTVETTSGVVRGTTDRDILVDAEARETMILDLPSHAEGDPNGVERRAWAETAVNMPWEGPAFVGAFDAE